MAKDLYLFGKDATKRIVKAVREVESHPPTEPGGRRYGARHNQIVAKITAKGGSDGYYEAVQVAWNGSSWDTISGGLTWDGGSNLPELYEANGETLIEDLLNMSVDVYVFPYLLGAIDGGFQWVFDWAYPYAVKVSDDDTTPNYLAEKIRDFEGNPIGTINNPGGDEQIWLPELKLGDVVGPDGVTYDGNIAVYDGTTGKIIKDSKGNIDSNGVFKLSSPGGNYISLEHDDTDGLIKWDDGDLIFQTQEAGDKPTVLRLKGQGDEPGIIKINDENDSTELNLWAKSGIGYISAIQGTPLGLKLQTDGACDITFFKDVPNDVHPKFTISGKDSGNVTRTWEMEVAASKSNVFQMTGVEWLYLISNLNIDGDVRISDAYVLPAADGTSGQFLQTDGSEAVSWVDGWKVKVSSNDAVPDYLTSKVSADLPIKATETGDGGDEYIKWTLDIHSATEETTVAADDEVLIYDTSGSVIRRMTVANFIIGYLKLLTGYDGGKNQVFVNNSSTLKWVDLATFVCP